MNKETLRRLCKGPQEPESHHLINVPQMTTYEYEWQQEYIAAKEDFLQLIDEVERLKCCGNCQHNNITFEEFEALDCTNPCDNCIRIHNDGVDNWSEEQSDGNYGW
jgi:hypothetical protein